VPQHATRTSFAPGAAGNPHGRPKSARQVTLEALHYSLEAIHRLVREMRTAESSTARIAAANSLLDRAVGKPLQGVDLSVTKQISSITSLDELAALEASITGLMLQPVTEPPAGDLFSEIEDAALGAPVTLDDEPVEAS
jgi:hypothetical protein